MKRSFPPDNRPASDESELTVKVEELCKSVESNDLSKLSRSRLLAIFGYDFYENGEGDVHLFFRNSKQLPLINTEQVWNNHKLFHSLTNAYSALSSRTGISVHLFFECFELNCVERDASNAGPFSLWFLLAINRKYGHLEKLVELVQQLNSNSNVLPHSVLVAALMSDDIRLANFYIKHSASANITTEGLHHELLGLPEENILHCIVLHDSSKCTAFLLKRHSPPKLYPEDFLRPLHANISRRAYQTVSRSLIRLLVEHECETVSVLEPYLLNLLQEGKSVHVHLDELRLLTTDLVKINHPMLKTLQPYISYMFPDDGSALFNLALEHLHFIPELLTSRSLLRHTDKSGNTALLNVCLDYSRKALQPQSQPHFIQIFRRLLENGAEVNYVNKWTNLNALGILAKSTGCRDGLRVLAEFGAVLPSNYVDEHHDGETVLDRLTSERYCRKKDSPDQLIHIFIELVADTSHSLKVLKKFKWTYQADVLPNEEEPETEDRRALKDILSNIGYTTAGGSNSPLSLKQLARNTVRKKLGDVKVIVNSYQLPIPKELQDYVALIQ